MIQKQRAKKNFGLLLLIPAVLFLVTALRPMSAEANEPGKALERGIGLYEKGDFGSAVQVFKEIIGAWKDPGEGSQGKEGLFTANLYLGMSYLGMGKESAAKDSFRQAFRAAPHKTLNPEQYSPKVISLYDEVVNQSLSGLTVKVNVPNAEVFLDDIKKGRAPVVLRGLVPGVHTIKVVAAGQESSRKVELQPENDTTVMFDFKTTGSISVSSEPSSASVYLNGKLFGVTPFLIREVATGEQTIRITMDGHLDFTQKIVVKENDVSSVNAKLEAVAYKVKISSSPENAEVRWNDTLRGRTPVTIENITPGSYKVVVSREGYDDVRDTIEVRNAHTEKEYRLSQHTGGLTVKSEPPGAEVLIDNKSAGTTPLTVGALQVKQYIIGLKKEGYREKSLTVLIAKDRVTEIQETLLQTDNQQPEITFHPPAKAIKENKNVIAAKVVDNQAVGEVTLMLKMEGEKMFQGIRMTSSIKGIYEGVIPEIYMKKGALLDYYIHACDIQSNCSFSGTKEKPFSIKVISLEPYTEGFVLDVDGDKSRATISLGSADGVKKQDKYVVFRAGKELRDPKSGELLQIEEIFVGVLKVKELMPRTAYAEIDDSAIPLLKDDRIRKRVSAPAEVASEGSHAAKIILRWAPNREPEVKGYRVYRSLKSDGNYRRVGEIEGRDTTLFEDTEDMMEGLSFYYQVAAYNRFGTDGLLSEPLLAKTKTGVQPPVNVRAEAVRYRELQIRWSLAGQDRDIEKYIIFKGEDAAGPFAEIGKVDRENDLYIDKENLKDGRAYYYRVAGKSRYGSTGEHSPVAVGKTKEGPSAPRDIRTSGHKRGVKLQWSKHEDRAVEGYIVYRNEKESGTFTEIGKTDDTEFVDSDVPEGKTFFYIVSSYLSSRGNDITGPASKSVPGNRIPSQ